MDVALAGQIRQIDVGRVSAGGTERFFVGVGGCGFDADVVRSLRSVRTPVKTRYVVGVVKALRRMRAYDIQLEADGCQLRRRSVLVAVANGRQTGGGMLIAPEACIDDGELDVCIVGNVSRLELLRMLPRMYRGGHRDHPAVEFVRCRELRAHTVDVAYCQADGELVGPLPATFTIVPGGVRCVVP
jgi:diacylglycerol kinase (ATP)